MPNERLVWNPCLYSTSCLFRANHVYGKNIYALENHFSKHAHYIEDRNISIDFKIKFAMCLPKTVTTRKYPPDSRLNYVEILG
jgi:hypothetical protein